VKPDWKDAPEWANYLARSEDGMWTWFEKKPRLPSFHALSWHANGGQFELLFSDLHWQDSLEKRPEKQESEGD
jgi:hypothetical protein